MTKYLYELTEEDKETITYHDKTFTEIETLGFKILDDICKKEVVQDYLLTIRSMIYKSLEINDTLGVMVKNSLIDTAFPILRQQFENLLQLKYIIFNKEEMEEKAIFYQYFDIKGSTLEDDMKNFDERMTSSSLYKEIHLKIKDIDKSKKRFFNWYDYYEGTKMNLKKISEKINMNKDYNYLYPPFSSDSHCLKNLESNTTVIDKNTFGLKLFRNFERNQTVVTLNLRFMIDMYYHLDRAFTLKPDLHNALDLFIKRATTYVNDCLRWDYIENFCIKRRKSL